VAEDAGDRSTWRDAKRTLGDVSRCAMPSADSSIAHGFIRETWGVKPDCPLSPQLFGLYVDPLEKELLTEDATDKIDGDCLSLAGVQVPCLLFADDLVLLSSTRAGLQAMLGALEPFSRRMGLTVNRGKTKVVVFGAQLQRAKQGGGFHIDGGAIETVGSHRYLGVEVSCLGR
jgi:hypothetical protein